jgi:hypothetical protein
LNSCKSLSRNDFVISANRFSITLFESIFVGACYNFFKEQNLIHGEIDISSIKALKEDKNFQEAITGKTTNTKLVKQRLTIAKDTIKVI